MWGLRRSKVQSDRTVVAMVRPCFGRASHLSNFHFKPLPTTELRQCARVERRCDGARASAGLCVSRRVPRDSPVAPAAYTPLRQRRVVELPPGKRHPPICWEPGMQPYRDTRTPSANRTVTYVSISLVLVVNVTLHYILDDTQAALTALSVSARLCDFCILLLFIKL